MTAAATVKAAQLLLTRAGFDPGPADGRDGPRTQGAAAAFLESLEPAAPLPAVPAGRWGPWPAYVDLTAFYGPPAGPACTAGRCRLPFAFPLAWDMEQRITSFPCHAKVAEAFTSIFAEAARHYGEAEFRRLQLDQWGGCFNDRPMRGSTKRSTHAWGIAVDVDPVGNELTKGRDKATLDDPPYDAWWAIVRAHGATSLGQARNYDWMHIQFCGL